MTSNSETLALQIVDNLKSHPIKSWQPQYTTWIVGRSMTAAVNRVLKSWGVLVPTASGNYTVNYDATIFSS